MALSLVISYIWLSQLYQNCCMDRKRNGRVPQTQEFVYVFIHSFLKRSHVSQSGFHLAMWLRMSLSFSSSWFHFPSAGGYECALPSSAYKALGIKLRIVLCFVHQESYIPSLESYCYTEAGAEKVWRLLALESVFCCCHRTSTVIQQE